MQLEKQDEMWMHAKTMINGELMAGVAVCHCPSSAGASAGKM
jgi:hypothetical protein